MCIFYFWIRNTSSINTVSVNSLSLNVYQIFASQNFWLLSDDSAGQRFTLVLLHYAFYKKRFDSFFRKNKIKDKQHLKVFKIKEVKLKYKRTNDVCPELKSPWRNKTKTKKQALKCIVTYVFCKAIFKCSICDAIFSQIKTWKSFSICSSWLLA